MIYVHLATGFEEIEAITITDVLRRSGAEVKTVSVADEKLVTGAHGITVEADLLFAEADYSACEMLVLPGGMPGTVNLGKHSGLTHELKAAAKACKWVCAICAAPMVLGGLGLLEGKKATIYPGMEGHLRGAEAVNAAVVQDGKIITSMGPGTAMEFAFALVEAVYGEEKADELRGDMICD